MRFGQGGDDDSLGPLADKRAAEYFAKRRAELEEKFKASTLEICRKLGLKPGETLEDYIGLTPSNPVPASAASTPSKLEMEIAIDDFFDGVERVLLGDAEWDDAFGKHRDT